MKASPHSVRSRLWTTPSSPDIRSCTRPKRFDYALVLSGECYMVLDDSEVLVTAGDVIIQRGTNHAWSNRSDRPCRIAFVLIDGTTSEA